MDTDTYEYIEGRIWGVIEGVFEFLEAEPNIGEPRIYLGPLGPESPWVLLFSVGWWHNHGDMPRHYGISMHVHPMDDLKENLLLLKRKLAAEVAGMYL